MIKYQGKEYKKFAEVDHIKKHTLKENTHDFECLFCEFSNYEAKRIIKEVEK